tara:strand:+ start:1022 stop:1219 length:198 start_codon:yes stop_codon:yes gene_type:complete
MSWIYIYLIAGVAFNFILDLMVDAIVKNDIKKEEDVRTDIPTKIILGIFWPFALIYLVYKLIKEN